jgi:hypothetical protein
MLRTPQQGHLKGGIQAYITPLESPDSDDSVAANASGNKNKNKNSNKNIDSDSNSNSNSNSFRGRGINFRTIIQKWKASDKGVSVCLGQKFINRASENRKNKVTRRDSDSYDDGDGDRKLSGTSLGVGDDYSGSDSDDEQKRASLVGLKKGSTDMAKLDYQKRVVLAKNIATMKCVHLNKEKGAKGKDIQVRKGAYAMIIDEVSLMFQIEREELHLHTIRRRMYNDHCLQVSHLGSMSPMEDIESHIVAFILQIENMKKPMSASEGLHLANSLIKGTIYQDNVIEWKKKKLREKWNKDGDLGTLGQTSWINLLKRNPQLQ